MFESLHVIIKERAQGTAKRNNRECRWRFEARNQANQVAEKDKESQRSEERCVAFAVVPNDLLALLMDESLCTFEDMLECSRSFD
jgi:hypothetical protein